MSTLRKIAALAGAAMACGFLLFAGTASAQTTPTVTLTPSSGLYDQQIITVSVGANTLFPAGQSVKIIECAVGATSDAQCDGNTINNDSILTAADGSFSYSKYELFVLPSSLLGEPAGNHPICDPTHECELYVGLNQTDFTQPKVFSAPFFLATSNPGTTVPETPYAVLLPIGAVVVLGGGYLTLRHRHKRVAHSS